MRTKLALAGAALALTATPAAACVRVGVYQDDPAKTLNGLRTAVGSRLKVVSVYVGPGETIDPALVKTANKRGLTLMVSWMPDNGSASVSQPRYRLAKIASGALDRDLKALGKQLRTLRKAPIVRPMPEPNTPWYPWSGTVNGNTPADYARAFKRVRKVLRASAGTRIKFLWTPYARSVPSDIGNSFGDYFPGRAAVDLVGVDAYNFGTVGDLAWSQPSELFIDAYAAIEALAPKPFWIGETGSTSRGGSKAAWIDALVALQPHLPRLAGVVWFDAKNASDGDFRIRENAASTRAFKTLVARSCR